MLHEISFNQRVIESTGRDFVVADFACFDLAERAVVAAAPRCSYHQAALADLLAGAAPAEAAQ
jgi:hypothetical protein